MSSNSEKKDISTSDQEMRIPDSGGKIPYDKSTISGGKIPVDKSVIGGGKFPVGTGENVGNGSGKKAKKLKRIILVLLFVLAVVITSYLIDQLKKSSLITEIYSNISNYDATKKASVSNISVTPTRIPSTATPTSTRVLPTVTTTPTRIPSTATPTPTRVPPTVTPTPTRIPPTPTPMVNIPAGLHSGSTFYFGNYEQDNNLYNGQEPIEWRVLTVNGNQALVISKYILDARQYHSQRTNVIWATSDIRAWLNNNFYYNAFSSQERNYILQSSVYTSDNRKTSGKDGNTTNDYIFLLDYDEAIKYFYSDSDRQGMPTAYARANRAYYSSKSHTSWWWLRWPGFDNTWAANVGAGGGVYPKGTEVNYNGDNGTGGIRPAFWIRIR